LRKTTTLFYLYTFVGTTLFFSGCTAKLTDPQIDFKPPVYVEQMPPKEEEKSFAPTGSIFGQGENPLFSDHKAMHVNDIVTVVISEAAKSSNSGSRQLTESDSQDLSGGLFSSAGASANSTMQGMMDRANGFTDVGFKSHTSSSYKGQGSATKNATFTTTVSARIVKVLRNGNYYIFGKREILVDDQKQIVQISGVIRPYDIDQYNKINSSQISDAKILYKTEGDVERSNRQGWGTKLIQSVWPF